ncbi:heme o synthase [Patulibacter sp. SYSU D01012]|uniref:heme o synthase n=1 Tax=Patulibacter sp. SYSU D01012 TaxID=2817381 RepID=UPI001FEE572D|nr:heme o synthase [Patulibacter sp. SYSU D01012]
MPSSLSAARRAGTSVSVSPAARQRVADLIALTKPKVQVLLLLTTVTAMYAAGSPSPWLVLATVLGGSLASGGASAINHWYDRDIDTLMERTQDRPIPSGRMQPHVALWVGLWLTIASFFLLALAANITAALLALAGFVWYVGVYTMWLKRRSTNNIVIGGLAGSFPPMVGWAAVTGGFAVDSLYPFAIVFAWTAPHFWALSMLIKKDYAAASIPMLPVVRGDAYTYRAIVAWSVITVLVSVLPVVTGAFGTIYLVAALVLGAELLRQSVVLLRAGTRERALSLHLYALVYLAVLFAAMVLDAKI